MLVQYLWLLARQSDNVPAQAKVMFRLGGSEGPEGMYTIPEKKFLRIGNCLITGFAHNAPARGGRTEIQVRKCGENLDRWVTPAQFRGLVGRLDILFFLWEAEGRRIALLRAWRAEENLGFEAHPGAIKLAA